LYCGQWDSTPSPGSNPPMSSWVFALNSFVLPSQEVERQSCSYAGSIALMVKFNLTVPAPVLIVILVLEASFIAAFK